MSATYSDASGFFVDKREHSSVGLERLLDKQEVSGSNPLVPTNENQTVAGVRLSFFMPSAEGLSMRFAWNG